MSERASAQRTPSKASVQISFLTCLLCSLRSLAVSLGWGAKRIQRQNQPKHSERPSEASKGERQVRKRKSVRHRGAPGLVAEGLGGRSPQEGVGD